MGFEKNKKKPTLKMYLWRGDLVSNISHKYVVYILLFVKSSEGPLKIPARCNFLKAENESNENSLVK